MIVNRVAHHNGTYRAVPGAGASKGLNIGHPLVTRKDKDPKGKDPKDSIDAVTVEAPVSAVDTPADVEKGVLGQAWDDVF